MVAVAIYDIRLTRSTFICVPVYIEYHKILVHRFVVAHVFFEYSFKSLHASEEAWWAALESVWRTVCKLNLDVDRLYFVLFFYSAKSSSCAVAQTCPNHTEFSLETVENPWKGKHSGDNT